MKYTKKCDHCGHQATAYTHHINASSVKALRQLVDFYEANRRPAKMKELQLTSSQYTNFNRLTYFQLAWLSSTGWVPTDHGRKFIYGDDYIKSPVAIMEGIPLESDHEAWKTHRGDQEILYVRDIDKTSYKQKEEYQKEKSNTLL